MQIFPYHNGAWTEKNEIKIVSKAFRQTDASKKTGFYGKISIKACLEVEKTQVVCCSHYFFFFLCISMILNLNCCYSILANRRKQKDWFLWKNMHQCMSRNWENTSSMLQSPPKELFYVEWTKSFTVLLHWIYDCEVTVSEQLILGALTTNYLTTTALLSS